MEITFQDFLFFHAANSGAEGWGSQHLPELVQVQPGACSMAQKQEGLIDM